MGNKYKSTSNISDFYLVKEKNMSSFPSISKLSPTFCLVITSSLCKIIYKTFCKALNCIFIKIKPYQCLFSWVFLVLLLPPSLHAMPVTLYPGVAHHQGVPDCSGGEERHPPLHQGRSWRLDLTQLCVGS